MSDEEVEDFEEELELSLYKEYRDVIQTFTYVVETERRLYLCNDVTVTPHSDDDLWFELELVDAWVWDPFRSTRFLQNVRVLTFRDVNIEEITKRDDLPRLLPK